ncbi:MAG: IPT/TIG domain-containing protein [bacterium]
MKKYFTIATILLISTVIFIAQSAIAETGREITSISPTSGAPGTTVTITGTGFEDDCGSGHWCVESVGFNEEAAQWGDILSWSDTEIIAMVPDNDVAGVDNIIVGYYHLVNPLEEDSYYTQYTITGPEFTVLPSPVATPPVEVPDLNTECKAITSDDDRIISAIRPTSGMVGDTVTITGLGFETDCGSGHACNFGVGFTGDAGVTNLLRTNLVSWDNDRVVIKVPQGAQSGAISVSMYCDSNSIDEGGTIIQYDLAGPEFTVLPPVAQAYGCSYSTTVRNTSTVQVLNTFSTGSVTDLYLNEVYNAYQTAWERVPRCDELQFHLDHSTPLERLKTWLGEVEQARLENLPEAPSIVAATGTETDKITVSEGDPLVFKPKEDVVFSGTTIADGLVTLYFSSEEFTDTVTADSEGAWTYTLKKNLGDGVHVLQTTVTDDEGEVSVKSSPLAFRVEPVETSANSTGTADADDGKDTNNILTYWLLGIAAVLLFGTLAFRNKLK